MSRSAHTAAQSTKDRLIHAASDLFRRRSYAGVGIAEILNAAGAPKGSLYHHFPNGKADLALATADWASDGMLKLMAVSFDGAATVDDGITTLCHKLAKLFDKGGAWDSCPVESALSDGPDNIVFRERLGHLYEGWIAEVALYSEQLGDDPDTARARSERFFMLLQGAWTLARARQSSDVLRHLPEIARAPL
ncbi:MAG: TetR family transcriptional regulator [Pseudooceanicola sp.]|nr:TetR family transcriptional regulator [Pseudooceanicola sp.]